MVLKILLKLEYTNGDLNYYGAWGNIKNPFSYSVYKHAILFYY